MGLTRIQALSEFRRKLIFWTILILVCVLALSFWMIRAKKKLEGLKAKKILEEIKPPLDGSRDLHTDELEQNLKNLNEFKEAVEQLEQLEQNDQEN